jgi:hypothetical protein
MMSAHGIENQLSRERLKSGVVRRGAMVRSTITTHSTQARDSIPFMLVFSGLLECCSRGLG